MSPFGHLGFHIGHGRDIDRDFSPMLHYMDGLDRHFFHGHRLISSFIPRFDLEEDDSFYYLIGDIPGAKAEDIIIEPSDDHTLIIHGDIRRFDFSDGPSIAHKALHDSCGQIVREMAQEGNAGEVHVTNETNKPTTPVTLPPQGHIRHGTTSYIEDTEKSKERSRKRVLLSERLTGDFVAHSHSLLLLWKKQFALPSRMEY